MPWWSPGSTPLKSAMAQCLLIRYARRVMEEEASANLKVALKAEKELSGDMDEILGSFPI